MPHRIDINCDMGESFGKFTKGNDGAVVPYVTTANVAAGFHGGDPGVMRETVDLATDHDVRVGVHPGLPDKLGFGRRKIDASPEEVSDYVVYQLGALRAVTDRAGVELHHVKPHGALYSMLSESEAHARAVLDAVAAVDDELVYIASDASIYDVASDYPMPTVFEGYVDLDYNADRSVHIPKRKRERDPELVADRFVDIATAGEVETPDSERLDVPADTVCVHSDTPNVGEILERIHVRLDEEEIELVGIDEVA